MYQEDRIGSQKAPSNVMQFYAIVQLKLRVLEYTGSHYYLTDTRLYPPIELP